MQANNPGYFIQHLHLQPHPEGGWYKETYRAAEAISNTALPARFATGNRSFSTAIYYLLQNKEYSAFHRIKSDECWHWYAGNTLLIHMIEVNGNYRCIKLGSDISNGEVFQLVVPAMVWFACELQTNRSFVLAGCTVAPGFDFVDFEMATTEILLALFPQYGKIITRLCK